MADWVARMLEMPVQKGRENDVRALMSDSGVSSHCSDCCIVSVSARRIRRG